MKQLKVLIACEESQRVCAEFRKLGHIAYSCDLIDCSGGHPEWHFKEDVLEIILNHGGKLQTGDYAYIEGNWDLMISHPPCFVAGTMVMTYDGLKAIEQIEIGDYVLTHTGKYKKVLNTFKHPANKIVTVKTENSGAIQCTPNHPFYTRNVEAVFTNNHRSRKLHDFEWTKPVDFIKERENSNTKKQTLVVNVIDDIKEIPKYDGYEKRMNKYSTKHVNTLKMDDPNFWYLVGRWLGDGWHCHKERGRTHGYYGIAICCSFEQKEELEQKIKLAGFNYYGSKQRTSYRFEIDNKELSTFMRQFGEYSYGKKIPGFVTRLTDELADALLNGYFESDGHICNGTYSYCSTSRELVYGIKYMVNKYWRVPCSISVSSNERASVIEGRKCKVRPLYSSIFRKEKRKQSHYITDDKYIYSPFRKVVEEDNSTFVYNLSVEDDESYTANGLAVHNCTFLAVSGARWFYHPDDKDLPYEQRRPHPKYPNRKQEQDEAANFFMALYNAPIEHIAVENPIGVMSTRFRKPDQIVHPYFFGDEASKATCLWLKNLPLLQKTNVVDKGEELNFSSGKKMQKWISDAFTNAKTPEERRMLRSKTFPGFAKAMADQWSEYLLKGTENE